MKKYIFSVIFLFVVLQFFALTLALKEKIYTNQKTITLQNIVMQKTEDNIGKIVICNIVKTPYKIDVKYIIDKLIENNMDDVNIIGNSTIVYSEYQMNKTKKTKILTVDNSPLELLKKHIYSFVNQDIFKINIDVVKTEPDIDFSKTDSNFHWEFPKVKYGLKDLANLKKLYFFHENGKDERKYLVTLSVSILANVWITNKSFLKNDFFQPKNCTKTTMDVSLLKDIDSVVYNIIDTQNTKASQNIGAGEILRWSKLIKKPLVFKNETLKLVKVNNSIKISLPVKVIQNGYLNEKIEVKLNNGNRVFGILKKNEEGCYVEML